MEEIIIIAVMLLIGVGIIFAVGPNTRLTQWFKDKLK
jgi:hypothetical protein